MYKIKNLILTLITLAFITGCSNSIATNQTSKSDKFSIVCTTFPEYDWIKEIIGSNIDNYDITILQDSGVDLHSFQPTTEDIITISKCDMFVYVGGQSDQWVEGVLKSADNKNMIVINMIEALGDAVKIEEIVEGMEKENPKEHEEEEEEEEELDEHIWLSINNAIALSQYITTQIVTLDPTNESLYKENLDNYTTRLTELDKNYKTTLAKAKYNTLVLGDRFPFRYLTDDYNLDYFAAFSGCSSESEASFETIVFLAKKVDEYGLNYVYAIEGSNQKIAETIIKNTENKNQKIATLNSMQSITKEDITKGATYISIMEANLTTLSDTLN